MSFIDPRMTAEDMLKNDICETMFAGHGIPIQSRSDMNACINALLRMYDVKRKSLIPIDIPKKES